MIVVYPMLTSRGVSPNVIPGIAKVIEKFIVIYSMDDLLRQVRDARQLNLKLVTGKLVGEQVVKPEKPKKAIPYIHKTSKKGKKEEEEEEKGKGVKVMELPSSQSLAIEPTWVQYQTPTEGVQLLGIKVIAFPVESDESLASLITHDLDRKILSRLLIKMDRKVIRRFYQVARFLRIPYIKSKALSGDPMRDVLWASSKYGFHTITLLNLADISEESFFDNSKNIVKLQKLGWGSFVAADEPNKRAIFCMQQFRGICTSVNYGFIFSSLAGEHGRVYNDLEEVSRSASPFFRIKLDRKKLFSECFVCSKKSKYRVREQTVVSFLKSLTSDKIKKIFLSLPSSAGDLPGVPLISFDRILGIYKRVSPNFIMSYNVSIQVIKNSTNIPEKLVEPVASIISFSSTYKVDDFKKKTKENLKKVVLAMRSIGEVLNDVLGYQRIILLTLLMIVPSLDLNPDTAGKFTCSKISKILSSVSVSSSDILIPTTLIILNGLIKE